MSAHGDRQPGPAAVIERLRDLVGAPFVTAGDDVADADTHDESLTGSPVTPLAVVRPATAGEVSAILALADAHRVAVVARGSGTGLSGASRPVPGCVLVCFDRMNRILEVDVDNEVAVLEPGVTLHQLDEALAPYGLVYPVSPGEASASLGGNVATNAGGMRAIRYGVTRHHVLGLELVLPGGQVIRTGGKFVKSSAGFDLTQLVVGSEGTLALVTEVTLKLTPRLSSTATLLAPFGTLAEVVRAVPTVTRSGVAPLVLEYLDALTMATVTTNAGVDLGVPAATVAAATAYLVVVLQSTHQDRLDADVQTVAERLEQMGALDVFVLPDNAGANLVAARERAFYSAKAAGAHDIVDAVVPRSAIPEYLATVGELAAGSGALIAGCGHVGDGNVHLSIFQADPERRRHVLHAIYAAGAALGGAVSGEHGIGSEKQPYFFELEDPAKLALQRRIKAAFDPHGILGPGRLLDPVESAALEDPSGPRAQSQPPGSVGAVAATP